MSIEGIINIVFQVYYGLLLARIILSFIPHNPYQPVIRFIYEVTEPWLSLFRRVIPPVGMFDLSPILAFFVLKLVQQLLFAILRSLGV